MAKAYEWMCTHCGTKSLRGENAGRPAPGNCPRRPKSSDGKSKPHVWVKNKTIGK